MANISRYRGLHTAFEAALRQNELYEAMQIVERCGASPELTEAIIQLGKRYDGHEEQLKTLAREGVSVAGYPWDTAS